MIIVLLSLAPSAMHKVTSPSSAMSMLWGNTVYCLKLSGEDLSRYSNKIESVALRVCPHYHYLTTKHNKQ